MTEFIEGDYTTRREYYWILARDNESGRPIIMGPYKTGEEANRIGFSKIGGDFEIIPLDTRNVQRANHILKYKNFDRFSRLEEITKRARHKPIVQEGGDSQWE